MDDRENCIVTTNGMNVYGTDTDGIETTYKTKPGGVGQYWTESNIQEPSSNSIKMYFSINDTEWYTNYVYDKDGRNNGAWWENKNTSASKYRSALEVFYDDLGRKTSSVLYAANTNSSGQIDSSSKKTLLNTSFSYLDMPQYKTSNQMFAMNLRNDNGLSKQLTYEYDKNGNINKYGDITYEYDEAGQLTRVNDPKNGTLVYRYDEGGNIRDVVKYAYTPSGSNPSSQISSNTYGYGDSTWKDKLTSYNGTNITYDAIGNPLQYHDGTTFTWKNGRQLATSTKSGITSTYKYDENGIRQSKTVGSKESTYVYADDKLTMQMDGTWEDGTQYYFYYDNDNNVIAMEKYGGTANYAMYYYVRNLQGDIIGILDKDGNLVVEYEYDSWGKLLSTTGSLASTIGVENPFRYRGYYYDTETGLYYLQSRYYDPATGRFINADDTSILHLTQGNALGSNLFDYCYNNPVNYSDPSGYATISYNDFQSLHSKYTGYNFKLPFNGRITVTKGTEKITWWDRLFIHGIHLATGVLIGIASAGIATLYGVIITVQGFVADDFSLGTYDKYDLSIDSPIRKTQRENIGTVKGCTCYRMVTRESARKYTYTFLLGPLGAKYGIALYLTGVSMLDWTLARKTGKIVSQGPVVKCRAHGGK